MGDLKFALLLAVLEGGDDGEGHPWKVVKDKGAAINVMYGKGWDATFILKVALRVSFYKKKSDEIVRYPRCIPPWNSMIATNSAIETSRST